MTRKDYLNIAGAIIATQARIHNEYRDATYGKTLMPLEAAKLRFRRDDQLTGIHRACIALCDFLHDDNPRFSSAQFLQNCGFGADQNARILEARKGLENA